MRRGARHRGARVGNEPLDQRARARRRGDELARPRAQPQAELQHVEDIVRAPPLGELVAPGRVKLRAAQAFRVLGRERLRHRAVRPFEPSPRRHPERPFVARRDAQQAGHALDHHLAHVVLALADERNVPVASLRIRRAPERERVHPFGAEPCLAGAAPAEHQPGGPGLAVVGEGRRLLVFMAEGGEVVTRFPSRRFRKRLRVLLHQSVRRQTHECAAQVRYGSHRCPQACHRHPAVFVRERAPRAGA